jgi:hypothetical protein
MERDCQGLAGAVPPIENGSLQARGSYKLSLCGVEKPDSSRREDVCLGPRGFARGVQTSSLGGTHGSADRAGGGPMPEQLTYCWVSFRIPS